MENRTSEDLCEISFEQQTKRGYLSCAPVGRSSLIPPAVNASHLATVSLSDSQMIMTNSHRQDPISQITESAFFCALHLSCAGNPHQQGFNPSQTHRLPYSKGLSYRRMPLLGEAHIPERYP
jgi:hypothetical protein